MDAQSVQLCPKLDASAVYYKKKLQLHNFTIYDIVTHDSTNYIWDETDGELDASVFTTIIIKRILAVKPQNIIMYSDGLLLR